MTALKDKILLLIGFLLYFFFHNFLASSSSSIHWMIPGLWCAAKVQLHAAGCWSRSVRRSLEAFSTPLHIQRPRCVWHWPSELSAVAWCPGIWTLFLLLPCRLSWKTEYDTCAQWTLLSVLFYPEYNRNTHF